MVVPECIYDACEFGCGFNRQEALEPDTVAPVHHENFSAQYELGNTSSDGGNGVVRGQVPNSIQPFDYLLWSVLTDFGVCRNSSWPRRSIA